MVVVGRVVRCVVVGGRGGRLVDGGVNVKLSDTGPRVLGVPG